MWKVLPKLGLLKVLLYIFSAIFLAVIMINFTPADIEGEFTFEKFTTALGLAAPVTMLFLLIIFLAGKWGWLLIWKFPFLGKLMHRSICPNLNGTWKGKIVSNYKDDNGVAITKDVTLNVKADLFGFQVDLLSDDRYQGSKVVQSELYKDPRTNTFYLSYIFESDVPIPEETDDRKFEGAAKLEIIFDDNSTRMTGTYWTNRAWQRRKNTAGVIDLSRADT